jgi:hypothetical protein
MTHLQFDTPTKSKIISVNPRSEMHGDALVPAVDVRFEVDLPNSLALGAYDPELVDAFYDRASVDPQASIPDISPVATHLRFPKLAGLKWNDKSAHELLTIDYGMGGERNVQLRQVKCHRHALSLREGGSVTVTFTASATNVSKATLGELGIRVQHEVHLQLTEGEPIDEGGGDDD